MGLGWLDYSYVRNMFHLAQLFRYALGVCFVFRVVPARKFRVAVSDVIDSPDLGNFHFAITPRLASQRMAAGRVLKVLDCEKVRARKPSGVSIKPRLICSLLP